MKSSRQQAGIWKTSALAMLLHRLTGGARHKLDPEASGSEAEAAAGDLFGLEPIWSSRMD